MARKKRERPLIEMHGRTFGRWTVLSFSNWKPRKDGRRSDYWNCRCTCGTERAVKGTSMRVGTSVSCGCYNQEMTILAHRQEEGAGTRNHLLAQYKTGAKRRGLAFELTKEEFKTLIESPCEYCGTTPSLRTTSERLNGGCLAGGIDRVDNLLGYVSGNCVACCRTCNIGKGAMPHSEWLAYLDRIVEFRMRGEDVSACL